MLPQTKALEKTAEAEGCSLSLSPAAAHEAPLGQVGTAIINHC